MEHIENFFRRIFNRLSNQIRYKMTNAARSKFRETVEKPFNQRAKSNRQTTTARRERNTNN